MPDFEVRSPVTSLPKSVRYVKNGEGSCWWPEALENNHIHLGWGNIPDELLIRFDREEIRRIIGSAPGATQDFNALCWFLDRPSQHIWVTFQSGYMYWCTVLDGLTFNPGGASKTRGHFWLTCDRPWSNHSLSGRLLIQSQLPGTVTRTASYPATSCAPYDGNEMLRIIEGRVSSHVIEAFDAKAKYQLAIAKLVTLLPSRDFEELTDLLLARSGWVRISKLGGVTEGVDVEAENVAANEIAFVQVKSEGRQMTLDDYVTRFNDRRDRYQRMIFVCHTKIGLLIPPPDQPVQVWDLDRIASMIVRHGLGDWLSSRLT